MPADGSIDLNGFDGYTEIKRTPIQEFYSGKTIFITGGTGFLGKLLIEKLVHVCPNIRKIYILVRTKKGKEMPSRIDDICNDVVFYRVKKDIGPISKYLHGIAGDCEKKALGLSEEDKRILENEVDIVFHVAATVRFDEPLPSAININVRATKDILDLMHRMKKLKAAIHVSTAYSNCKQKNVGEQFYPPGISCDEALALPEDMNVDESFLRGWPNTYCFTKAIGEDAVRKYGQGLPIGIFRPSMITGTTKSGPLSGWIDNQYGPTGAIMGVGCGLIRTLQIDMEKVADLVPGDMCANTIIAAGWSVAKHNQADIPIYNFVSSPRNKITWDSFISTSMGHGRDIPPEKGIWCMSFSPTKSYFMYILYRLLLHTIPATIADAFLIIFGSKIRMKRVYRTVHKFSEVITYFCCNDWIFTEKNTLSLWSELCEEDRKILPFNISELNWSSYLKDICNGARIYLLGENPENLQRARAKYRRYVILHNAFKIIFTSLLVWLSYCGTLNAMNYFDFNLGNGIQTLRQINTLKPKI